jgi:hypothetical protein
MIRRNEIMIICRGSRTTALLKSRAARSVALVGLMLLLALPALAQLDRGTILGTVLDPSGAVVPGATVLVESQETGFTTKLSTNAQGIFAAPELHVGTYRVSVSHAGFATRSIQDIRLHATDRINLRLTLEPGAVRQTVTVTSGQALVQTATTTYGEKILSPEITNLPLNGRDPMQLLETMPGTDLLSGFDQQAINGTNLGNLSSDAMDILVDGADSSRVDYQGLDNTYGSSENRITHAGADTIQEFSISQNSYSAEFGGPGNVINMITKSGTNQLHGDAYEYFGNTLLNARNYFDPAPQYKPSFNLNQFGGSLGGPIKKDKAWFFGNYEGIRQRTGISQVTYVPTNAFRMSLPSVLQPVVAMLPLPNGPVSPTEPDLGLYTQQVDDFLDENTALAKVDYDPDSRDRLTVRYNMEDSLTQSYFGVAQGQIAPSPGLLQNSEISYTRNLSPNTVNVASVSFNRMRINPLSSTSSTVRNFSIVTIPGSNGVGPELFNLLVSNNSFSGMDTVSMIRGRNQIQYGGQIIRNQDNKELGFQRTVTYLTLASFAANQAYDVSTLGQPRSGMHGAYYALFVQDDVQASQRLTLNAGVRYQYDTAPGESHGRIDNFDPATGSLSPEGNAFIDMPGLNFAPRFGLAYRPSLSHQTVVRASFGIFFTNLNPVQYQNMPNNIFQEAATLTQAQDPSLVGFPFPSITSYAAVTSYSGIQHDWGDPYTQSWNFDIQQGIGANGRLDLAYVGNRSVHDLDSMNLNRFFPGTAAGPYPTVGPISYLYNGAVGNYNALEASVTERLGSRLQFDANYTYSHMLSDSIPLFGSLQNDHDPQLDYGNDAADATHVFEFDYVYQLPGIPRAPAVLGKGWQVNGIATMRSGLPFSVSCGCDPMRNGEATGRADPVPGVAVRPANYNLPLTQLNFAAFAAPSTGTWGTTGNNAYRGPADYEFDFSLFKNFRVGENKTLEFRTEVYNLFNTPEFGNPSAALTAPSLFGASLSTLTDVDGFPTQRQVDFALRFTF